MRRVLMAAAAAAVIGIATPASAAVQFASYSGPDLTKIKASLTNPVNDVSVVYGCVGSAGCADVTFTGQTGMASANAIHITDGGGFASITDAGGPNLFDTLVVDVTSADFNQYMFSLQLVDAGTIFVYYNLASGGGWVQATPLAGIAQNANSDNTYLLSGGVFTQVMVYSAGSAIKEFKQQSVTLGSVPAPVPEPATWALMLLGFGGMGMALRRSRRSKQTLMQIA